jgi:ketosteroid isomerase-like protein
MYTNEPVSAREQQMTQADPRHDDHDDDHESLADWFRGWGGEVAAADIAAGRQRFSPDLLAFGTHADIVAGRDEVEAQQWAQVWPAIDDFWFEVDSMRTVISGDRLTAVAIVPWGSVGVGADGQRFDRPGRATVVLERASIDAPWIGVHTHFSLARGVPQRTFGQRTAIR